MVPRPRREARDAVLGRVVVRERVDALIRDFDENGDGEIFQDMWKVEVKTVQVEEVQIEKVEVGQVEIEKVEIEKVTVEKVDAKVVEI